VLGGVTEGSGTLTVGSPGTVGTVMSAEAPLASPVTAATDNAVTALTTTARPRMIAPFARTVARQTSR
jgi:hypothetical protein